MSEGLTPFSTEKLTGQVKDFYDLLFAIASNPPDGFTSVGTAAEDPTAYRAVKSAEKLAGYDRSEAAVISI